MKANRLASLGLCFVIPCVALTGCTEDASPPEPPPEPSPALQADLQATLDGAVATGGTPGAVLHVSGPDGTWSGAAGVADIDGAAPMTPDVRFRAGSIVKTLVATAILQTVEEGTLGLNDVLTDRLPVEVTDRIENAHTIDVAMLLGHQSGIPDWMTPAVYQGIATDPAHVWTLDDVLDQVEAQAPAFDPGESFAYSNTNYVLLGEILAAVDGRSWRESVRERVIDRAGMIDTALPDPGDVECSSCARGYIAMEGEMIDGTNVDPSMAGASGGHALISTTSDLGRFLRRLRAGSLFEHAETLDAMFAIHPAIDHGEAGGHMNGYGFGIMRLDFDGEEVVGHLGGTAGYMSFMLHVPATDRYVTGFINVMGDPGVVLIPAIDRLSKP